jgi:hypothetical protein
MITKKSYNINDIAWIAGINSKSNRLVSGRVIKIFTIEIDNYDPTIQYYVIEVPTSIEPLLEIRTWETMSQDKHGPVGCIRDVSEDPVVDKKCLKKLGMFYDDDEVDYEPSEEEILAAIEKSKAVTVHPPLHLKSTKLKRRFYNRKKKQ